MLALGRGGIEEARLEDYVVSGLVDFDDISYDGSTTWHLRPSGIS
ncbi:MAG: hypothetical protein ACREXW_10750 [Gammaproteobacteria bacterium]